MPRLEGQLMQVERPESLLCLGTTHLAMIARRQIILGFFLLLACGLNRGKRWRLNPWLASVCQRFACIIALLLSLFFFFVVEAVCGYILVLLAL